MKNFYPYQIPIYVPFHLKAIPVFGTEERIDFFYKYKRSTENFYLGDIDTQHLTFVDSNPLLKAIEHYFHNKHYSQETLENYSSHQMFPKICWLVDSFFKQGFTHPLCVHYNPRIQQNVIHPGSIRSQVINLFQETPTAKCLYFNTGGVEFDFIKLLRVFTKDELLTYKENIEIELVADHGAIIPHINLDVISVKPNVLKWQYFIYRRLLSSSFTVFSDIELFKPWYAAEHDANIQIYIDKNQPSTTSIELLCKAVILAMIGKSYKSDTLTVIHKNSFETPQ